MSITGAHRPEPSPIPERKPHSGPRTPSGSSTRTSCAAGDGCNPRDTRSSDDELVTMVYPGTMLTIAMLTVVLANWRLGGEDPEICHERYLATIDSLNKVGCIYI